MNSTVQAIRAIPELQIALSTQVSFTPSFAPPSDRLLADHLPWMFSQEVCVTYISTCPAPPIASFPIHSCPSSGTLSPSLTSSTDQSLVQWWAMPNKVSSSWNRSHQRSIHSHLRRGRMLDSDDQCPQGRSRNRFVRCVCRWQKIRRSVLGG